MTISDFLKILNDSSKYCPSCGDTLTLGECLECLKEMELAEEHELLDTMTYKILL
jgi:hypothetical protein